jgi:hypothetical protein
MRSYVALRDSIHMRLTLAYEPLGAEIELSLSWRSRFKQPERLSARQTSSKYVTAGRAPVVFVSRSSVVSSSSLTVSAVSLYIRALHRP